MVTELAKKFIEIAGTESGESDDIKQTIAYGLGVFAFHTSKEAFAPYLDNSVAFMKGLVSTPDAFEEDKLL